MLASWCRSTSCGGGGGDGGGRVVVLGEAAAGVRDVGRQETHMLGSGGSCRRLRRYFQTWFVVVWAGHTDITCRDLLTCDVCQVRGQTLPGEGQTLPGEGESLLGEGQALPGEDQILPGEDQYLPGENWTLPGEDHQVMTGTSIIFQETHSSGFNNRCTSEVPVITSYLHQFINLMTVAEWTGLLNIGTNVVPPVAALMLVNRHGALWRPCG